jgi:hypothetical protein
MPKKKGTKDRSHLNMYWRKGWRLTFNRLSRIIFPRFDEKRGSYNDDF